MPLSPNVYKGHERAHSLVEQWRKNRSTDGGMSDTPKLFDYSVHLEAELDNCQTELTSLKSAGGKPASASAALPAKSSPSLVAMAGELDAANARIAELEAQLAEANTKYENSVRQASDLVAERDQLKKDLETAKKVTPIKAAEPKTTEKAVPAATDTKQVETLQKQVAELEKQLTDQKKSAAIVGGATVLKVAIQPEGEKKKTVLVRSTNLATGVADLAKQYGGQALTSVTEVGQLVNP